MAEVLRVAHLEGEPRDRQPVARGVHRGGEDIDVVLGEHPGDIGEQALAVQRLDLDLHQEHAGLGGCPSDIDDPVGAFTQFRHVAAVGAVHRHARAPGDEPDDGIRRDRGAAPGELDPDIADPDDGNAGVRMLRPLDRGREGRLGLLDRLASAEQADQVLDHVLGRRMAVAHGGVQRRHVGVVKFLRHRHQRVVRHHLLQRQVLLPHGAGELVLALFDRLFAALLGEPLADLVPCPRALDEALPILAGTGALRLGREDFHPVAVAELAVQRDQLAVDPGTDGAVADLGVHRIGEVHRR
jgi:hypothetical protein